MQLRFIVQRGLVPFYGQNLRLWLEPLVVSYLARTDFFPQTLRQLLLRLLRLFKRTLLGLLLGLVEEPQLELFPTSVHHQLPLLLLSPAHSPI